MVEDVEELTSKNKPHPFGQVELPLQRKICLPSSETPQHIAPEIALLPAWPGVKAALLKILPPGYCGP